MKKIQTPSQKQLDKLLQEAQEAMNELPLDGIDNLRTAYKTFVLDYSRIKTVEDLVEVLKGLAPEFQWYTDKMPEQFEALHWKGFLIEKESIKFNEGES
jgi:hypothetical protein